MDEEVEKGMSVSFGAKWVRSQYCTLGKRKGEWVLHFSGKATLYKVKPATYGDFLNLRIEDPMTTTSKSLSKKPGDDVIEFFGKWGPLGLWFKDFVALAFNQEEGLLAHVSERGTFERSLEPFEEYWMRNHTRKLRFPPKDYPADMSFADFQAKLLSLNILSGDYFETWHDVHAELWRIQRLCERKNDDDIARAILSHQDEDPLFPFLQKVPGSPKKYEWAFAFKTLSGALIGLLAQEVIGKVDMRECKNCGRRFNAIGTRRSTFCTTACMNEYPDKQKREDPVIKYRRMLQRRLERRPEVSDKKSRSINDELLTAKSVTALQAIEEKYPVILGKKKGAK